MASPFPSASVELDYPLYALGFDPHHANRLVVGGGGGASRTGTVLETDAPDQLHVAGELELSRDEDSVMSLAFCADQIRQSDKKYIVAGVNSSPEIVAEKGVNQHLRCLSIEQSKARAAGSKVPETLVAEVSRHAFFEKPDADTYQRLLRVAGRIGAAASGMGKEAQLAVFDATAPEPRLRGLVELPRDAEDLDVVQVAEDEHLVAFCYKYELHLVKIGGRDSAENDPELVFTMPDDHGERPAFRSIRFLTPNFILAVSNLPQRSGAIIQGFRLPTPGHEKARVAANVRIPGRISATALAVANVHPATPAGDTQFAIAVAANDGAIHLYTLQHQALPSIQVLSHLYPLHTLRNAHPGGGSITGVAFSTFTPPATATALRQHLKLASITLQKSVAVHSIPLKKHVDTKAARKDSTSSARYVIAMRSRPPSRRGLVTALSIMVLILAVVGQAVLEMYGHSRPVLQVHRFLPSWYGTLRDPAHPPAYFSSQEYLVARLAGTAAPLPAAGETLVVWEESGEGGGVAAVGDGEDGVDIKVGVHDEEVHGAAKTWEELSERQKRAWRERLQRAGAWTQNMGESVFRGILFSELAGAVGRAVGG